MDDRLTPSWSPLEAVPVALLAYSGTILVGVLLGLLLGPKLGFVLAQVALGGMLALVTAGWVHVRAGTWREPLGLGRSPGGRDILYGIGAGVALYAVAVFVVAPLLVALISIITGEPVFVPRQGVLPDRPTPLHISITGVAAIVGAPLGEELLFRGFLFGSLRARMSFWPAALISAAVFGGTHLDPPLLIPIFLVVGLGLAYVYERRRSLWPSMAAHAAFNVLGYTFLVSEL